MRRGVAVAVALLAAGAGQAQLIIPNLVGAVVRHQLKAGKERACRGGVPLDAAATARASAAIDAAMRAYLAAAARGDWPALLALFSRRYDAMWVGPGGDGGLYEIADPVAGPLAARPPAATLLRTSLVVAGDGETAQGVWSTAAIPPRADGLPIARHLAQFAREKGAWRILYMKVGRGFDAPPTLVRYCHVPGDIAPTTPR